MSSDGSEKDVAERAPDHRSPSSVITSTVSSAVSAVIDPVKHVLTAPATRKTVAGAAALSTITLLSIGTAIFAYLVFYYLYVPTIGISKEVSLQYGYGKPPFDVVDLSQTSFASDQVYDVSLELMVPTSRKNIELGNFMVELDLRSADGLSVLKAARAASITHTPHSVQLLQFFTRLPTLLFSPYRSLSQRIEVPLVKQRVLRAFMTPAVANAMVQVGRHDAHKSDACVTPAELQVYAANLVFKAHLRGFRAFMYNHRIISFAVFTTAFIAATLVSALSLWAILALRSAVVSQPEQEGKTDSSYRGSISCDYTTASTEKTSTTAATGKSVSDTLSEADRRAEEEVAARQREARQFQGRRMVMGEEESVLKGVKIGSSGIEDEGVLVKTEEDIEEDEGSTSDSASAWQELEGQEAARVVKKEEEGDDDGATVAGSATSAGDAASRLSFGPSVTTATSVTGTNPSLRQRPSSRSLRSVKD